MSTEPTKLSADQRTTILNQAILANSVTSQKLRVESQGAFQAVLVFGEEPKHLLHLLIGALTCGLWWIVWIVLAITTTVTKKLITVDEYGSVDVRVLKIY